MPYISLNDLGPQRAPLSPEVEDGVHYAHAAVRFAALGLVAKQRGWGLPQDHLYALAVELAFKSLALRSGATLNDCRKAGHRPSKMISLIERLGTTVPQRLKTRLANDKWFEGFLFLSRYPARSKMNTSLDTTIFLHPDYPEMIAAILETPCRWPLRFERGNALAEIYDAPAGPREKLIEYQVEPSASPNGGPALGFGNSGAGGGPPSVS